MLFTMGLTGLFINRKNLIISALCLELIFLAINYDFLINSASLCELHGQIVGVFVLTVTAAETSCALALLVTYFLSEFDLAATHLRVVKH